MRAKELVRFYDPAIQKQIAEMLRAINSIAFHPDRRDVGADGTPRHDVAPQQFDGRYVDVVSLGVGIPVKVSHSLRRVPVGFQEIARTYAAPLIGYPNEQATNASWTKDAVYFVPQGPKGSKWKVILF